MTFCLSVSRNSSTLKNHEKLVHERKQKPFECRQCGHPVSSAVRHGRGGGDEGRVPRIMENMENYKSHFQKNRGIL